MGGEKPTRSDKEIPLPGTAEQNASQFAQIVLSFLQVMGWNVEQFGILYGKAVKNQPYTKERIYQMIRNNSFPEDSTRRWIIAKILQIPPAYFGVSRLDELLPLSPSPKETKPSRTALRKHDLDLEEFHWALQSIEERYTTNTAIDCLSEIRARIHYLHDEALYKTWEDAKQLKQLVCGYQMAAGNILRDHFRFDDALKHLNRAVALSSILATDYSEKEIYVHALMRRGILYFDKGKIAIYRNPKLSNQYFDLAAKDFNDALKQSDHTDPQVKGDVLLLVGATMTYSSQDKHDISKSLKMVEDAERFALAGSDKDKGIYYLDRASAFIASPMDNLRDLSGTFEALNEAAKYISPDLPRRYSYMSIIEAMAHFEKGWYPTATQIARDALEVAQSVQSGVNITRLANLYQRLQESSYGKSIEVAEFGIELIKVQYPSLFDNHKLR